jgi:uridylate kinase
MNRAFSPLPRQWIGRGGSARKWGWHGRATLRVPMPALSAFCGPAPRKQNMQPAGFGCGPRGMAMPTYRRVIVKLSGEALSGPEGFGIHQPTIDRFAADIVAARAMGVVIGVVVGGGNVLRGVEVAAQGVSRPTGDAMGMLATVINALVLEAAIERAGASARSMSALTMPQVCETYERQRALRHLDDNRIVIFAGGTGNPYFTTDTTAVLRAAEMGCDAVLKATNVDGIYTADPKKDKTAQRFDRLTHQEAFVRELKVMDATAFALARENRMPIIVFSILEPGAIKAVLSGTARATIVGE